MKHVNDEIIKQSHKAFRLQLKTVEAKELAEIIKNYKLLLNQLEGDQGEVLMNLIDIAEKSLKTKQGLLKKD